MNNNKHLIILGAGPAGAVTALALKKLGFKVTVISTIRKHQVIEGISARVLQALTNSQLTQALTTIPPPVARYVNWNKQESAANVESLINRQAFDRAILVDLKKAGITVIEQHISKVSYENEQWQIHTQDHQRYQANFLVEARGRAASSPIIKQQALTDNLEKIKGNNTLSFAQNWQIADCSETPPFTYAMSFKHGWLWLAYTGNKLEPKKNNNTRSANLFTQISINRKSELATNKAQIAKFIQQHLTQSTNKAINKEFKQAFKNAVPVEECFARDSTPIVNKTLATQHYLRIGDAAMAVDPLSGNGIFQSLSSALSAPAVINTLLNKPENSQFAIDFYQQRIEHLFYRFCRIGRDFYQLEQQWPEQEYWQQRRQWPDQQPAHSNEQDQVIGTALRPVLNNHIIEQQQVLITKNQPLGIWKIDGKNAVEIWKKIKG